MTNALSVAIETPKIISSASSASDSLLAAVLTQKKKNTLVS